MDYDFNDKNSLNLTTTYLANPNQRWNSALQTDISNTAMVRDSFFTTANTIATNNQNLAADLTFIHQLKNPERNFRLTRITLIFRKIFSKT